VGVKADKVQSAGKSQKAMIAKLEQAGIPVQVSAQSRLLHHKFTVVDGRWVITGSFNWTISGENQNRENLLILDCPDLARSFAAEWDVIRPDEP
jgi:phosphatidylserine/phosphatidylglycerophosphate/cardiolipin synthase-like enzyme